MTRRWTGRGGGFPLLAAAARSLQQGDNSMPNSPAKRPAPPDLEEFFDRVASAKRPAPSRLPAIGLASLVIALDEPTEPCRDCGLAFWVFGPSCPQCSRKRWEHRVPTWFVDQPARSTRPGPDAFGWYNSDTGQFVPQTQPFPPIECKPVENLILEACRLRQQQAAAAPPGQIEEDAVPPQRPAGSTKAPSQRTEDDLVVELRRGGKAILARFVAAMIGRGSASALDVGSEVRGDEDAYVPEKTARSWCDRASKEAERLGFSVRYRLAADYIHKSPPGSHAK
jgi:hypothetical protein